MSRQGFDTWIVEVRGAGLSTRLDRARSTEGASTASKPYNVTKSININGQLGTQAGPLQEQGTASGGNGEILSAWEESQLVTKLTDTFMLLAERLSGYINETQLRAISDKFFDQMSKLLEDAQLSQRFDDVQEKISGLLEAGQNSAFSGQIRDLSERLVKIIEESQRSVSPQLFDLQEQLSATIEDFQNQLDLIVTYNWDFDNYLEEDIPSAVGFLIH